MRFTWRFITLFLIGSTLLAACNMPGSNPASNTGLEITQTLQALSTVVGATLAAAAPTEKPPATSTKAPAETPEPETTATPTLTPTIAPSKTPATPMAHVNTNTNCRSGPSTAFDQLYVAEAGENLKVVARTTFSDYVLVENPRKPGNDCWLWTKYVKLSGDLSGLPEATPPPTPTPVIDAKLSYTTPQSCTLVFGRIKATNTGEVAFKSYRVNLQALNTSITVTNSSNDFDLSDGCGPDQPIPELAPGNSAYLYGSFTSFTLSGPGIAAKVVLCTENNQKGTCINKEIQIKP